MSRALLAEVGWEEGFAIPVANAENKALQDELQMKQTNLLNLGNRLNKLKDVINALTEHLKNLRQEVSHTQGLCRAREKETEAEEHFRALAERETGRLKHEITQLENQLTSLNEKKNSQESSIFKASQKLDELKNQLNWDQQTLEAWLKESAHRDEDTMAILKYAKQDERKIRELTLNMEKLTLESTQKRKTLDNELIETVTAQLLAEINQTLREKNDLIKERKGFMQREVENNQELERNIGAAERQMIRLRQQLLDEERNQRRLQDEVEVLKGTLDRTATDVETTRSQLASMKKALQEKTETAEETKLQNTVLKEKLLQVMEAVLDGEEQAAQMETLLKEQEHSIREIKTLLLRRRELLFKKTRDLQALRDTEKNTRAEISAGRTAMSNIHKKLRKLDQNLVKGQMDFQIQMLERKALHLQGNVDTKEKEALETKVADLTGALEEKKKTAANLARQLKKLQDDIRCTKKDSEKTATEKRDLTSKIQELELFIEIKYTLQESMVEKGLLKMEVQRLRDLLYDRADGVLTLEKRCLQLKMAMKEREEEIHVHQEVLNKQVKLTEQERQGLSAAVNEAISKIDRLRKRYEILSISLAAPEGEEDKSQAFFIIKRQGDDLDSKIRKTEKEISALENTLHVVNNCNTSYRKSLSRVPESSPVHQEKMKLEEQRRAAEEKYKLKRRQTRELEEDVESMSKTLEVLVQEEASVNESIEKIGAHLISLNKDVDSLEEKLKRASKQCTRYSREIHCAKGSTEKTFEERDVDLRELRDLNKSVNKLLLEAMENNPELSSLLEIRFLQLPLQTAEGFSLGAGSSKGLS
ncbi:hypothetical protein DNTS_033861 [Danionella cerebrum]|uniref:Coiled-coil domain-containing protein 39 n=1 Tax=Danionella cerebrum TaxID=2873325 RepID=A0A553Q643_9TELE|nr:hypothetical protein DNTS_033861 [Danionella translucida]